MRHSMRTEKNLSGRSSCAKRSKLRSSILSALLALTLVIGNIGIQIQPVMAAAEGKVAPACGKEEHMHNNDCYDDDGNLKCVKEEHVHNDACEAGAKDKEDAKGDTKQKAGHEESADKGADVEDPSLWNTRFGKAAVNDDWRSDLTAVAETQLGYKESKDNYKVAKDGSHKGYTRYGHFSGDKYADWSALFVNFCMHYAGMSDSKMFPEEKTTAEWHHEFAKENAKYLASPKDYKPQAGDIVFFEDKGEEAKAQMMGIVSNYDKDSGKVKVLEGNSDDQVEENTYQVKDERIADYLNVGAVEKAYKDEVTPQEKATKEQTKPAKEESKAAASEPAPVSISESFDYKDEALQMTFHVKGTVQLPQEAAVTTGEAKEDPEFKLQVEPLEQTSKAYKEFANYAEKKEADSEQVFLEAMNYSLMYGDETVDLSDCEVTAEAKLTKKMCEQVQEEDGKADASKEVTLTLYGRAANNKISEQKSVTVKEKKLSSASVDGNLDAASEGGEFAIEVNELANPKFTVQYYANLDRVSHDGEGNYASVPIIDTSKAGDGTGGDLPQNGKKDSPNSNKIKNLYISKDDADKGSVKTETVLTEVYKSRDLSYYKAPSIKYCDALIENPGYERKGIWILKKQADWENEANWKTKVCGLGDTHTHTGECYKENWVVVKEEAGKQENTSLLSKLFSGEKDEAKSAGQEIQIPSLEKLHFTNRNLNKESEGNEKYVYKHGDEWYMYIYGKDANEENTDEEGINEECAKLRFEYDPKSDKPDISANFYDYDITTGVIYNSKDAAQNKTGGRPTSTQGETTGVEWANTWKAGINNNNNYSGIGAKLALGNSEKAISTGLGDQTWNENGQSNKLNMTNIDTSYKGCTFGLVTGLQNGKLQYAKNVDAPNLFNDGDAIGKTAYDQGEYSLKFKRSGDTHTLTAVNGAGAAAHNLERFENPSPYSGKTHDHIWTNNFWPMDSALSWGTDNHDLKFGDHSKQNKRKSYGSREVPFPENDDGKDHNSCFGMQYQVDFELVEDYVGPLEYYFFGDDDMWVFLDGKLVCDIGGVHSSVGEYVDLWDYLEKGKSAGKHTLSFFYTERGAFGSTCWMQFTLPSVTSMNPQQTQKDYGKLQVEKEVTSSEIDSYKDKPFKFKLQLTDSEGKELLDDYAYTLYNVGDSNAQGSSIILHDKVHSGQEFTLKHGQYVDIEYLPLGTKYIVEELNNEAYIVDVDGKNATKKTGTITSGQGTGNDVKLVFTNTPKSEVKTSVAVTKVWKGVNHGTQHYDVSPSEAITVRLLQNGELYKDNGDPLELKGEGWSDKWIELPKYDANHKEYEYTVTEDEVPGFSFEKIEPDSENKAADIAYKITNKADLYEAYIKKTLNNYNATLGGAKFVYNVKAVRAGKTVYSNVLAIDFKDSSDQTISIGKFPKDTTIMVEEVYSGSCYELTDKNPVRTLQVTGVTNNSDAMRNQKLTAEYTNVHDDRLTPGTGAVNRFEKDNGTDGGWIWTKQ